MRKRIALVTGASKGIGRSIAFALAANDYRVVLTYESDSAGASATAEKCGSDAIVLQCSVDKADSVDATFTELEQADVDVDILVNNAGISSRAVDVRHLSVDEWHRVVAVNLSGVFYCIRRAIPGMARRGFGRVVNIGSAAGPLGPPWQASYAASKAGLVGLTRSVAAEFASRGITCNIVAPGPIEPDLAGAIGSRTQERYRRLVPIGRFGLPSEVAAAVLFLASEQAAFITGCVLPVDGGMSMHNS